MQKTIIAAQLVSSISFFLYGSSCLLSKKMRLEFERYHLAKYRVLTGALQILGSVGLAAGFFYPWFTLPSSLGLTILMFMGIIVRIRIKDSLLQASPAIFYCLLNLYIFLVGLVEFNVS